MKKERRPLFIGAAVVAATLAGVALVRYERETRVIQDACASGSPREVAIASWQSMARGGGLAETSDTLATYCTKDVLEQARHAIHDPYSNKDAADAERALVEAENTIDRERIAEDSEP